MRMMDHSQVKTHQIMHGMISDVTPLTTYIIMTSAHHSCNSDDGRTITVGEIGLSHHACDSIIHSWRVILMYINDINSEMMSYDQYFHI